MSELWLLVISFPPPNSPSCIFLDATKLPDRLKKALIEGEEGDYNDVDGGDYERVEGEIKLATVQPAYPVRISRLLRYYVR